MSDVRSAFMTQDQATIRDTAQQLWSQVSEQDASFLVLDPTGPVIASLGGLSEFSVNAKSDKCRPAAVSASRSQAMPARISSLLSCPDSRVCPDRE